MQIVETFGEVREIIPDAKNIVSLIPIVLFVFQREGPQRSAIESQPIESRAQLYNGYGGDTEAADRIDASHGPPYPPMGSFPAPEPSDGNLLGMASEFGFR